MRRNCIPIAVAWLLVCLQLAPAAVSADDDKPDLGDILKGAVQDALSGTGDGELGSVRRVEVTRRALDSVELSVELRGVAEPERTGFAIEVYDDNLRAIEGIEADWDAIPSGDGSVVVRLHYVGAGEANSVGVKVSLVDRSSGRVSSRRKAALPWRWQGTGSAAGGSGGAADSSSLAVRDTDQGAASREPVIVELTPERIGDTPAADPIRIRPVGVVATAERAPTATPKPQLETAVGLRTAMAVAKPSQAIDLYAAAAKASWRSSRGELPFGGSADDERGCVRALGTSRMIDGKGYANVLQTHPAWTERGRISGSYQVTLPSTATRFEARCGFLAGVTRSDGVTATVRLIQGNRGTTVVERVVEPRHGVVELSGAIPQALRGRQATLELAVQAGASSEQDWFAWVAPVVR